MATYGWIITKDHLAFDDAKPGTNCNAIGVIGPRDCVHTEHEIKSHGLPFKMYDDDDELYYEGFLLGGDGFEPLEDFGTPNAGCTKIEVDGKLI